MMAYVFVCFWGGGKEEMICAHARALSSIDHLTNEPPFSPPQAGCSRAKAVTALKKNERGYRQRE